MQITLALILAGTLGLAMLVSHRKMLVKLTTARSAGDIEAKLPSGWRLEKENDPPIMFMIREPAGHGGRLMTIRCEQKPPGITTLQFLKASAILRETNEVLGTDGPQPMTVAGVPGLLVQRKRPISGLMNDEEELPSATNGIEQTVWIAAGVLPSGQAISVVLECPQEIDAEADKRLMINTAEGITVTSSSATTQR